MAMAIHRMQQVSRGILLPAMAFTFVVLLADTVYAVAFDCLGLEVSYTLSTCTDSNGRRKLDFNGGGCEA